ncbi:tail protein [Halolamina pelagica]|uniref:Tail protein n=1 Tax=Halolamina pelagica TaxID=699431 RepID=A0A0P7GTV2_9EURY|nr:tail protein [Halolamina pelagica]
MATPGPGACRTPTGSAISRSGDDKVTLTGTLLPQLTGGQQSLDQLRKMLGRGRLAVDRRYGYLLWALRHRVPQRTEIELHARWHRPADRVRSHCSTSTMTSRIDYPVMQACAPCSGAGWRCGLNSYAIQGDLPEHRITASPAGQQISPQVDARLQRLRLTDKRGMDADQLDITLEDSDGRLALPPRGTELHLAMAGRVISWWIVALTSSTRSSTAAPRSAHHPCPLGGHAPGLPGNAHRDGTSWPCTTLLPPLPTDTTSRPRSATTWAHLLEHIDQTMSRIYISHSPGRTL